MRRKSRPTLVSWIAPIVILGSIAGRAQTPAPPLPLSGEQPLDVRAGRLEYDDARRLIVGRDGVVIRHGGVLLRADYMEVHRETRDVRAQGNVILIRADGSEWRGQDLVYNLITGHGDFGAFVYRQPPFTVEAAESSQEGPRVTRLRGVTFTTCDQPPPREFEITASEATLIDRRYLQGRHAVVWLGPLPVLYMPWFRRDLQGENRWSLTPGYTSRLGPFLLVGYRYPLTEDRSLRGTTSANLYGRRGIGFEQEVSWRTTDAIRRGQVRAFYIEDRRPWCDEAERDERSKILDDDCRYRLGLGHTQQLSPQDALYVDLTYLSDPWVTKDFRRREYRRQPVPDNRIVWQHATPEYTFSLMVHRRLNDFYEDVNRLPEARFLVPAFPIADSRIYYTSESSAARLERVHPKQADAEDYDASRFDTRHELSYPGRYFGFLSITPRAAWRGTWYSDTLSEPRQVTQTVTTRDEEGREVTTTEVTSVQVPEGAALRNVFELGFESSFKAFGVLEEGETAWGHGLRHVVEPYARHTYIPEPNRTPVRLYQFDDIDRIDRTHDVRFGVRNKFQTRREGRTVHDLVDADVNTLYRLTRREGERDFDTLNATVRLRPQESFWLDFDGRYDPYDSEVVAFNSRLHVRAPDASRWNLEYRYRAEERNQLLSDWTIRPGRPWSFGFAHRMDLDAGRLDEHTYWVERRLRCIGWSLGFGHEPGRDGAADDYRVWVRLWLLAFPEWGIDIGG